MPFVQAFSCWLDYCDTVNTVNDRQPGDGGLLYSGGERGERGAPWAADSNSSGGCILVLFNVPIIQSIRESPENRNGSVVEWMDYCVEQWMVAGLGEQTEQTQLGDAPVHDAPILSPRNYINV